MTILNWKIFRRISEGDNNNSKMSNTKTRKVKVAVLAK